MRRRLFLFGGLGVVLIIAGFAYAAHFASTVNGTHKAAGAIVVPSVTPTTPVTTATGSTTSASAKTFQIVPAQTTASYSVYENLIFENKPNNDAIGTTHSVQGSFDVQTGSSPSVTGMKITVDLSTLQTDSAMRDSYVRHNTLQTDTYPYATFVSVSIQGLPSSYSDGQTVHFQLTGNMTMHGKTNKEVFDVQGKIVGNTLTGTATTTLYMTDFGIQPPDLANIAVSQNKVVVTVTFTAKSA